jgi:uracil phosphoribosyltransferase
MSGETAVATDKSRWAGAVDTLDHPLVDHALAALRSVDTGTESFRRSARAVAQILALRVLQDLPTREVPITTPLQPTTGRVLDRTVVFVPVLRAGLALLDAMSDFVPGSKVGFVGLERDETTAIARSYYQKLPQQLAGSEVIILDPMLATGGSALATIELLTGQQAARIRLACVVAAPEGIEAVLERHPDVRITAATIDSHLNERKYIVPGLGDFGDRYFGTV